MRRFLYFLPSASGCPESLLAKLGIADRFPGSAPGMVSFDACVCDGPCGNGVLLGGGGQPPLYLPESQDWMEGERYWVGCDRSLPPGPDELARLDGLPGYETKLGDGRDWIVPRLLEWNADRRTPDAPCHLPARQTMQNVLTGGTARLVLRPRFREASEIASKAFEGFAHQRTAPFDALFIAAAKLLSVNYRLGVEEINLLGLFDPTLVMRVLTRSFDYPAFARSVETEAEPELQPAE
jgi:hypothetical protein